MDFSGFSPETIDFLWGIRFNNNREWFEPHKKQYQTTLYEPMKALGRELSSILEELPGLVCKVSRIYRDARMHPPTPYKESLWICLREDGPAWMQQPVLFFELTPDDYSYGLLYWQPGTAWMEQFRRTITRSPEPFLDLVAQLEAPGTLQLSGQTYKRPKPCPDPRLERFYALKNITAYRTCPIDDALFTADLAQTILSAFRQTLPLYHYCKSIEPA